MLSCVIIPARGGSKGISRKNARLLAGKPLVAHTIEKARQARSVSRIVVSTDDPEIASVAEQYGAEAIWRPAEFNGDTVSSEAVLLHSLEYLQQTEKYKPDLIVFLQCTSPLTLPEDIDGTIQTLLSENADSALAVTPFHHFLWQRDGKGEAVSINHDKYVRLLRQERKSQFLETGAVYVMRTEGFKTAKHRFFGKIAMYEMPRERCLGIDDPVARVVAALLGTADQARLDFVVVVRGGGFHHALCEEVPELRRHQITENVVGRDQAILVALNSHIRQGLYDLVPHYCHCDLLPIHELLVTATSPVLSPAAMLDFSSTA